MEILKLSTSELDLYLKHFSSLLTTQSNLTEHDQDHSPIHALMGGAKGSHTFTTTGAILGLIYNPCLSCFKNKCTKNTETVNKHPQYKDGG